ncbi:TPA: putative toxin-antitoxin system toxin component, PIN family [Candidatus Poribacteria bacterium]|nr:putative toxin-antitoxin system toxin component, PIN family [Candidatus Poribacteria bacterium]HEX28907.1 putative toxin-antitoxin system toxin component, PIN family [Candidatus Poribacteria bacterium]
MIKAVLDANVSISGLISRRGAPGKILKAWRDGRFRLLISPQILNELRRALYYPKIRSRVSEEEIDELIEGIFLNAEVVSGEVVLEVLKVDPADNIYLSCAVEGGADYIVTGNIRHFEELGGDYSGIHRNTLPLLKRFTGVLSPLLNLPPSDLFEGDILLQIGIIYLGIRRNPKIE